VARIARRSLRGFRSARLRERRQKAVEPLGERRIALGLVREQIHEAPEQRD
jgi:hypothetical protein